jgi:SAM-dependent methyltransferase
MAEYLLDHAWTQEEERLAVLESIHDPATHRRIAALGIGDGWRCLEVGAGRGSIARWLSASVAPTGSVVATDLETGFLADLDDPGIEVLRHDVLADEFPEGAFDLIHARFVLMHIPERRLAIERMARWLAPGGWLVCEEPDWCMALANTDEVMRRTFMAYQEALPTMDFACGRALAAELQEAGLADVCVDGELDVARGGSAVGRFYHLSMLALSEPVLASGSLTEDEFDLAVERVQDPDLIFYGFLVMGAAGRRPD